MTPAQIPQLHLQGPKWPWVWEEDNPGYGTPVIGEGNHLWYFIELLEPLWDFQDYGDHSVNVDETDVVMQVWKNKVIAF